ncbi:hypothetical protein EDD68_102162 [Melghiribacillus thermohalophilus]|uniref:Capsular polysaccharide biosynthesis protein n=1 Tax=Melghiribacillus thermohalophilus TaxID=1324956 RepID=A0A4R3NDB0_9BACI|nr:hypothetical protein [Melghiribacillus thermohalophilus]TCT26460.1 hypothetical protein EDD68_102162 [Melghiribacillus thermohalophilus]
MDNLKDIRDWFINIEKNYQVFDLKYKNIAFWKLIRKDLFEEILMKRGLIEQGHPMSVADKFKRIVLLIKYSILNISKRKNLQDYDVLILSHGRKIKYKGDYVDAYLYDIIEKLKIENKNYLFLDRPDHYGKHLGENVGLYYERFGHLIRDGLYKLFSWKIKLQGIKILKDIEDEIKQKLKINIKITHLVKKKIFRFYFDKKFYDKLLDKIKPKEIYLVVSYGKEELIAAAKERGILVKEVQHGVINNYHMGYYFPVDYEIPYFPDEIITFGEYWIDSVKLPINNIQSVNEFKCLKPLNNILEYKLKSDDVLFISQGTIGKQLSSIAADFISKNKDVKVYYKLHPSEFNNWEEKYKDLYLFKDTQQLEVITNQLSIYYLLNKCKYVIGVNSTAIFESLLYNCKTFVVNIEGYQYMDDLIKRGYVKLISTNISYSQLKKMNLKPLKNKQYFYY